MRIHVSYDPSQPELWNLDRPYERQTTVGPIVVPQGFETDLASTPHIVWRTFARWGPWSGAAIVHDWLYRTQPAGIDRYTADRIMLDLMRADGVRYGEAENDLQKREGVWRYRLARPSGDTNSMTSADEGERRVQYGSQLLAQTQSPSFLKRWRAHALMVGWWNAFKLAWRHKGKTA